MSKTFPVDTTINPRGYFYPPRPIYPLTTLSYQYIVTGSPNRHLLKTLQNITSPLQLAQKTRYSKSETWIQLPTLSYLIFRTCRSPSQPPRHSNQSPRDGAMSLQLSQISRYFESEQCNKIYVPVFTQYPLFLDSRNPRDGSKTALEIFLPTTKAPHDL